MPPPEAFWPDTVFPAIVLFVMADREEEVDRNEIPPPQAF